MATYSCWPAIRGIAEVKVMVGLWRSQRLEVRLNKLPKNAITGVSGNLIGN
jgi:hypothetical protein